MSLAGPGLLWRFGLWALIRALPREAALRGYLRAAYFAMASVIIGSVLTGGALAMGLVFCYRLLTAWGWAEPDVLLVTGGACAVLIVLCFGMANIWLRQLLHMKDDMPVLHETGQGTIMSAIDAVAEGFLEGLVMPSPARERPLNESST